MQFLSSIFTSTPVQSETPLPHDLCPDMTSYRRLARQQSSRAVSPGLDYQTYKENRQGEGQPQHKRKNIFKNGLFYYNKCQNLEKQIEQLKNVISYLVNQVKIDSSQTSGSENSHSSQDQQTPSAKIYSKPGTLSHQLKNTIKSQFFTLDELLAGSRKLGSIKNKIFGWDFDVETVLEDESQHLLLSKQLLDLQISSIISMAQPKQIQFKRKNISRASASVAACLSRKQSSDYQVEDDEWEGSDVDSEDSCRMIDRIKGQFRASAKYRSSKFIQNARKPTNLDYIRWEEERATEKDSASSLSDLMNRHFNRR